MEKVMNVPARRQQALEEEQNRYKQGCMQVEVRELPISQILVFSRQLIHDLLLSFLEKAVAQME